MLPARARRAGLPGGFATLAAALETRPHTPEPAVEDTAPASKPRRSREHWLVVGSAVLAAGALVALGLLLTPDARGVGTHEQLGLRPCTTMKLWNIPCPGCGLTTSVTMATQGDFWVSFKNQPFGLVCFLLGVAFVVWTPIAHFRGRDLWADVNALRIGRWAAILGVLAALAWVYKIWLVRAG